MNEERLQLRREHLDGAVHDEAMRRNPPRECRRGRERHERRREHQSGFSHIGILPTYLSVISYRLWTEVTDVAVSCQLSVMGRNNRRSCQLSAIGDALKH